MYKPKLEKDIRCPLEYGLDIFGGKWTSRILCVLSTQGTIRYSQLRRDLADVTDAVLSSALKDLIANDMVERSLTDKGRSALPLLQSICRWSGVFFKDETDTSIPHCQHCDYRGHAG